MRLELVTGLAALVTGALVTVGCASSNEAVNPLHPGTADAVDCSARLAGLAEGQPAPDFIGESQTGGMVALSSLRSRTVVLHFYPVAAAHVAAADDRAWLPEGFTNVDEQGVIVIGVSRSRSQPTAPGQRPTFVRLADAAGVVSRAYGEASLHDDAASRTFVIGPDGTIEKVYCLGPR